MQSCQVHISLKDALSDIVILSMYCIKHHHYYIVLLQCIMFMYIIQGSVRLLDCFSYKF